MRLEPQGMEVEGIEITLEDYEWLTVVVKEASISIDFRHSNIIIRRGFEHAEADLNKLMDEIKEIKSEKVLS